MEVKDIIQDLKDTEKNFISNINKLLEAAQDS